MLLAMLLPLLAAGSSGKQIIHPQIHKEILGLYWIFHVEPK